jgi:hypothetical protein
MVAFEIVGFVLIVVTSYYLSRRSNRKAIERLRTGAPSGRQGSPAQVAKFELMRAEHAARARAAQTDSGTGPIG